MIRSVRDIDNQKRRKFLYTIPVLVVLAAPNAPTFQIPPSELQDTIQLRLPSPSGETVAIIRNEAKDGKLQVVLEVWKQAGQTLERRIDLSRHHGGGKVICDVTGGFGVPSWNADETVLVYAAECEPLETASFFETTKETGAKGSSSSSKKKKAVIIGGQNTLGIGKSEHWGEKYSNQSPLHDLFCVNLETGNVGKVKNVPGHEVENFESMQGGGGGSRGYTLGQPVFHPVDGQSIVYTGWDAGGGDQMPKRLGLIYCQQRPCQLYHSPITKLLQRLALSPEDNNDNNIDDDDDKASDAPFTLLTPDHRLSHSPRFAPLKDGSSKLVFLTSVEGFETHSGCFALGAIDLVAVESSGTGGARAGFGKPSIVVDLVWDPTASSETAGEVAGLRFPGLFMLQLPVSCFLSPDFLVATTQWGSCQKIVRVSLQDGTVQLMELADGTSEFSSEELLCVGKCGAIISTKTPEDPGVVHLIFTDELLRVNTNYPQKLASKELATFPPIASTNASPARCLPLNDFTFDIRVIDAPFVDGVDCNHPIQSILLLPDKSMHAKPPLIVIPHGGPHSVSSTAYLPSCAFLCGHGGYAILLVNYRGSTGFGQDSIEALPTNIGTLDIQDVIAATNAVKVSGLVDPDKIGICGGSHGGFLTAHGTSQYPDFFRAAVMRNPVVNIASMVTTTDIPDWCYVEACGSSSYNWKEYRPPTLEQVQTFYSMSPVQYIGNVQTPTLIALGLKDLRVPPSQGLEWYHTLRSMGVPTKLLTYDNDDHAIDGVASEADHWINIKHWFDHYLR